MITKQALLDLLYDEIESETEIHSVNAQELDFYHIADYITYYWLDDNNNEIKYNIVSNGDMAKIDLIDYQVTIVLKGYFDDRNVPTYRIEHIESSMGGAID